MKFIFAFAFSFICFHAHSQYAPQAGLMGSTAIYKDSLIFVDWANHVTIQRGWLDIADTSLGKVNYGDLIYAYGKADAQVISLGDAGEAIYFFENPIVNDMGYDFAIFENGFRDPLDSNLAYLELAQVEVSNDGVNYYSFASYCTNDTNIQIAGVGEYMDARHLHNLAGKYIAGYGTPFDLEELNFILGLDIDNIRFIKIKDVVGSIHEKNCTRDFDQYKINDPYPSPFPTGGFDLDALGIIHHKFVTSTEDQTLENNIQVYPNPTQNILNFNSSETIIQVSIYSMDGRLLKLLEGNDLTKIDISFLNRGSYLIKLGFENKQTSAHYFLKNE
ncbi:MAG TPA: T9SS type A sorting domain-containing protein [Chitinophagaceae bacterium]|nr:T9SS type A sorting domain-containing protein [Chitinophagaceae bacterium]